MLNKKNYFLFIILVFLVGAAWFYTVPYSQRKETANAPEKNNFLSGVNPMNIDRIVVKNPDGKTVAISKINNAWTIEPNQWPTEQILINTLVEKLGSISVKDWEVVSVNPDKKADFDVGEEGQKVTISKEGVVVADLIFGKVNSNYSGNYLSREGDNKTYLAPETFVRALDTESWADRTVTSLAAAQINTLILQYPAQTIELTNIPDSRGEEYWRSVKPYTQRLKTDAITAWLEKATNLEATDIPDQNATVKNALAVTLKTDSAEETLIISDVLEKGGSYLLEKKSTGQKYIISKETKDDLFKTISSFL